MNEVACSGDHFPDRNGLLTNFEYLVEADGRGTARQDGRDRFLQFGLMAFVVPALDGLLATFSYEFKSAKVLQAGYTTLAEDFEIFFLQSLVAISDINDVGNRAVLKGKDCRNVVAVISG